MNTLVALLLSILLRQASPGATHFSVEPVPECAGAAACESGRWSTFYGTWVRRESLASAEVRYGELAAGLEVAAEKVAAEFPGVFSKRQLIALGAGVAIIESGLREDVQMGRGRSGRTKAKGGDDAGGQGRGPGNEACVMQIRPIMATQWVIDADPEVRQRALAGDRKAREAIARSLLGRDPDAIERCFRTGLRMLAHNARFCRGAARRNGDSLYWAAVSMYVGGESCSSLNGGKTVPRVNAARAILAGLQQGSS